MGKILREVHPQFTTIVTSFFIWNYFPHLVGRPKLSEAEVFHIQTAAKWWLQKAKTSWAKKKFYSTLHIEVTVASKFTS